MNVLEINKLKIKLSPINIYMMLIMIMPISTLLQEKVTFINRILFLLIFSIQIIVILKRLTYKYICIFWLAISSYILVLMNTKNLTFDNSIIYFINFILYSGVICLNKDAIIEFLYKNDKYVRRIMFIWTILVGISIFIPSCYYIKEGGQRYFGSYLGSIFRLGPTALFIETLSLVSIVLYKNKRDILFMIIPLFCGFMGSSRTYFLVIICVFCIALYITSKNKVSLIIKSILGGILGIIAFKSSSMSEKIAYTLDESNYGDFWFRITSSRSVIWSKIINGFNELNIFEKIFGAGFGFSNSVAMHYSHNDFIEIIVTHGYIGIILYMISIILLIKILFKNKKIPFIILFLCIFIWFFNAFFNMFYSYICVSLSYPFLLIAVACQFSREEDNIYYGI